MVKEATETVEYRNRRDEHGETHKASRQKYGLFGLHVVSPVLPHFTQVGT